MNSASDAMGLAGSKPKLITIYTSGTGTYVPTVDGARCLIRIQAAGAGGHASNGGGGGGRMSEVLVRVPTAGIAYAVGAGGAIGTNGSISSVGAFSAVGGSCDTTGSAFAMYGGVGSVSTGGVNATGTSINGSGGLSGVDGGSGGRSFSAGCIAGFPINNTSIGVEPFGSYVGSRAGNGQGNNSGGNSFYGKGGTTGNAPAVDAYGAGGGVNAPGRGGCVEIWDMGA